MGKLGINAKVYYRSAGSHASPTFTAIGLFSDVAVNPTWDEGDASSRASRIKKAAKTQLGLEVTARLKKKPLDAAYEAVMNALVSDDVLDILILDGDSETVGNRGWRFDAQVFSANEDQAMANVLYEDIVLKPACTENEPKAVKVGAGPALTYSTPGVDGATFA